MKLWIILIRSDDDFTWVQAAWDDDSTAENPEGWKSEVDAARKLVSENPGYDYRIAEAFVPGLYDVFEPKKHDGHITEVISPSEVTD